MAFSLVELIAVIAILGLLVALLLPAVQSAREVSRRGQCLANMRQLNIAVMSREGQYGCLPYGNKADVLDSYTWLHQALPYMELQSLYEQFENVNNPIQQIGPDWPNAHAFGTSDRYQRARTTVIRILQCPSDRPHVMNEALDLYYCRSRGNYRACAGSGDAYSLPEGDYTPIGAPSEFRAGTGIFSVAPGQVFGAGLPPKQCRIAEIADGCSNTVTFSEGLKVCVDKWSTICDVSLGNMGGSLFSTFNSPNSTAPDRPWGACPRDGGYKAPCISLGGPNRPPGNSKDNQWTAHAAARSHHPRGSCVAFADGSTRIVTSSIDLATWRAMGTKQSAD